MHAPEVIEVKGSGIIDRGDDYIAFWERIQGKKFKVYYYFDDVGLMHIEYHFEDKVREGESYLDLMYLYRDVLSSKFGDPGDPKMAFSVDIDPNNLEQAVRDGKLRYVFFWEDETHSIELRLGRLREDGKPLLAIIVFMEDRQET